MNVEKFLHLLVRLKLHNLEIDLYLKKLDYRSTPLHSLVKFNTFVKFENLFVQENQRHEILSRLCRHQRPLGGGKEGEGIRK